MLVSVDPGLYRTGCVAWQEGVPFLAEILEDSKLTFRKDIQWLERLEMMRTFWKGYLGRYNHLFCRPGHLVVVCELAQVFTPAASSGPESSVAKLIALFGSFQSVAKDFGAVWVAAPVVRWKGQLPKTVVRSRVRKILGMDLCNKLNLKADMWDAAGIGLWYLDRFNKASVKA